MECKSPELTRRQMSKIRTIAADFVLYNSEKIKTSYREDTFFEELQGEIEDSLNYFKEKFPSVPSWVFWEVMFNKLNKEFSRAERGEGV